MNPKGVRKSASEEEVAVVHQDEFNLLPQTIKAKEQREKPGKQQHQLLQHQQQHQPKSKENIQVQWQVVENRNKRKKKKAAVKQPL